MKTLLVQTIFLFCLALIIPKIAHNQNIPSTDKTNPSLHHEVPGDPYLPNASNPPKTSPSFHFKSSGIFTTQVNVSANQQNILGDAANEPSIAVDASNPARMVIGWRQFDNVNSNFRQAGYAYTADSGMTWTFPGVLEPTVFRSDPVLDYDTAGNI